MSHLPYPLIPEGGKKFFSFRDPKDVVVSTYHFMDSALELKGRVALPLFAHAFLDQQIDKHIQDILTWWEHHNDKDVLLIFFDNLKEDHVGSVLRIAKFMGVDCNEEEVALMVHTTSHAEMSRHAIKFDRCKIVSKLSENWGGTST